MKLTQEQVDAMTLPERGLWLQCESMELEITSLRAEYKSLLALAKLGRHDLCEAAVELRRLQAENESLCALAKFGRKCFESHRDGLNDLDGDDLQKWAMEFGLLKETKVFAPCNSDPDVGCWCREYHGEFPCICIKSTALAQLPEKRE